MSPLTGVDRIAWPMRAAANEAPPPLLNINHREGNWASRPDMKPQLTLLACFNAEHLNWAIQSCICKIICDFNMCPLGTVCSVVLLSVQNVHFHCSALNFFLGHDGWNFLCSISHSHLHQQTFFYIYKKKTNCVFTRSLSSMSWAEPCRNVKTKTSQLLLLHSCHPFTRFFSYPPVATYLSFPISHAFLLTDSAILAYIIFIYFYCEIICSNACMQMWLQASFPCVLLLQRPWVHLETKHTIEKV